MSEDGTTFEENLSLGDELQIILYKNNWKDIFENLFTVDGGFLNKSEIEITFRYLSKIRNPGAHGKTVMFKKEDLDQCKIYLSKLNKIIPETI